MNNLFFPRLALINIRKNGKFYVPYMITCISSVAMFYIMRMISLNEGIKEMPGSYSVTTILMLGTIVIGIFSAIFLFYTNSFLMKRRKKEIGLYNILGMEKKHIARILFFETSITGAATICLGLLWGILFSKLIFMFMFRLLHFTVPLGFFVSRVSIVTTIVLFCGIFLLNLFYNLMQIHLSNPIDLLKGSSTGEREPKSKKVLALVGIASTGTGYYIALVTKSPLSAMYLFFIAVILVIVGTYCLFTAGSIVVLKRLKQNRNYYYRTKHFTSISGMIYRMKQNAVGLANICILSTAVLVMISTTVALYMGVDEQLENRCPNDVTIALENPKDSDPAAIKDIVQNNADKLGRNISSMFDYQYLEFYAEREGDKFVTDGMNSVTSTNISDLYFITTGQYEKITGEHLELKDREVLFYSCSKNKTDSFTLFDNSYTVKANLEEFPIREDYTAVFVDVYYIVANEKDMEEIYENQLSEFKDDAARYSYYAAFDSDGTKEEKSALADSIYSDIVSSKKGTIELSFQSKQQLEEEFYAMIGGFLFLGIFLGLLFLSATVLIIYYKQISEGYDDRERFEIMQKVGMSRSEVRTSIKSQIIKVFFLPLAASIIHIAAAFKMITRLLLLFNLTNVWLFAVCTVVTIAVFAAIYFIVYAMTARVYYRIVQQ
ncbi:MAG: ABC transporter permease [Sedimentibacter sp.]|uniref:ABC transporter permease n=1 Tax=Sedimentibacter sp. TaxID=1960295 RepID=UPI00315801E9